MLPRSCAKLDQPVCALEGLSTWLLHTPGELAVILHADPDCVNVLPPDLGTAQLERFFCTNLGHAEAAAGHGAERLQACLELVCRQLRPPAVVLLGSCAAGLVGADLGSAAERVSRSTGVPVICPPGPAMQFVSQVEVADRFATLMSGLCEPAERIPGSINLLGFDPGLELVDLLAGAGVPVNAILDLGAPFADWQRMAAAQWTLVTDGPMYAGTLADCEQRLGQRHREVPFPIGLAASGAFLESVFQAVLPGRSVALGAFAAREQADRDLEHARPRTRGRRLGYNLGSLKNFAPVSLARAGLLDLPAYQELGFEIVFLLQGDDRPERLTAARQVLDGLGHREPIAVFADTVDFGRLCRQQGCDLVVGADYLGGQLEGSRIGFLPHGRLRPGFAAVVRNLHEILAALERETGS